MRLQALSHEFHEDGGNHSVANRGERVPAAGSISWPAWAGVLGPLIFGVATTMSGLLRTGYDPIRQFVSELGVGAHAWLYNDAVIAVGVLELPFFWSLTADRPSPPSRRVARVLFLVFCAATLFLGLVPTRHHIELADASFLHVLAFVIGSVSLIGAILLMTRQFATLEDRAMALFSCGCCAIACLLLAFPIFLGPVRWYQVAGLIQRLLLVVLMGWLEAVAIRCVLDSTSRTSNWR